MVNLESEFKDNNVKLKEQPNKRKDRYSSLSMGNFFIKSLERNLINTTEESFSNAPCCVSSVDF